MIFAVTYLVIGVVTAVIFSVAMITTISGSGRIESDDWWIAGLFGLCAGMVWPLTVIVWGVVAASKKIYYASREESNV